MLKEEIATLLTGPYNTPHTIKIDIKEEDKLKFVFAELIEGEWSLGEISYSIYNYIEEKLSIKPDEFVMILKLDDKTRIFEVIVKEKSRLESKYIDKFRSIYNECQLFNYLEGLVNNLKPLKNTAKI